MGYFFGILDVEEKDGVKVKIFETEPFSVPVSIPFFFFFFFFFIFLFSASSPGPRSCVGEKN